MNTIFFCSSIDKNNPIIADTLMRAKTMANSKRVSSLSIISVHGDDRQIDKEFQVYGLGKKSKLKKLIAFYKAFWKLLSAKKIDYVYLYMTPSIALFLFPLKFFFPFRIASWFGHTQYRWFTKLSLIHFTDIWFNSNKSMAPFFSKNLHLVGQGVDENKFYPKDVEKKYDLVTVGRIAPIKKIEKIFEAMALAKKKTKNEFSMLVCGDPFVESDKKYKEFLVSKTKDLGIENQVIWAGNVHHDDLPKKLWQARAFIFVCPGGIGKASLEALACGTPLIISNTEARDFFGDTLSDWFLCEDKIDTITKTMIKILTASEEEIKTLKKEMADLFFSKYTTEYLFERILSIMEQHLKS